MSMLMFLLFPIKILFLAILCGPFNSFNNYLGAFPQHIFEVPQDIHMIIYIICVCIINCTNE